jgi:hypothetical protein
LSTNDLKKITDPLTIRSLLATVKEQNQDVFVWKLINGDRHMAQVRFGVIRKERNDFLIIACDGQEAEARGLLDSATHIDLYVPGSELFMRSSVKRGDTPGRYYIGVPELIAQLDRRRSLRLNTYSSEEVKLSFTKTIQQLKPIPHQFAKNCYDISTGGFSFLISKAELKYFEVGQEVPEMGVKIANWSSKPSAKITGIREYEPDANNNLTYKVWRVSCAFTKIDDIGKKYLERYIFERLKDDLHAITG